MGILSDIGKKFFGGSESQGAAIDATQQPFLKDIYNRAQLASYGGQGQQFGEQFLQPSFNAFNQQAQGGFQTPGLQQGLQNFGGIQNEALGGAIDAGLGQINRNFQRNIMPSINQGAALTGTSGGSRQGIAQGLAAGDANDRATDFVNQMQSNNWGQQMQNQLGAYGQQAALQGQQNTAQSGAMNQAQQLSNLGFGNQYGNLASYSSLVGGPTVLGGGSQNYGQVFSPIKL